MASDQVPELHGERITPKIGSSPEVGGRPRDCRCHRRICGAVALAALLVAFLLLQHFDIALMRWRFVIFPKGVSGGLQQIVFGLRDFGQFVPIVVAGVIVVLADRRWRSFVLALVLAQALGLLAGNAVKWSLPRYRPYPAMDQLAPVHHTPSEEPDRLGQLARMAPAETWIRHGTDSWPPPTGHDSFPSGHSNAAFAFAIVLACFYPRLRWVFWVLATGCAVSRVLDAMHWPSDCLAGAAIGYAAGWLALRIQTRLRPAAILPER